MDERRRGIAGRRNLASWWGNIERNTVPESADVRGWEREGSEGAVDRRRERRGGRRMYAGPRRRGRLIRRCWYQGWRPCCARFEEEEL